MRTYCDGWVSVASALFAQALAGEPELAEALAAPLPAGAFGFAADLAGDAEGRFAVLVEGAALETPLVGEGQDQKSGWKELLRETFDAACGELLAQTGKKCQVAACVEITELKQPTRTFHLRAGERTWTLLVEDEVRLTQAVEAGATCAPQPAARPADDTAPPALSSGLELLLDVELEATLRFGSREMPLGEILELGPGDVVELDRHVSDPVDLVVGDKIVARGDVVLVNGNFGLRVTEVAVPRKRLESIRCLF